MTTSLPARPKPARSLRLRTTPSGTLEGVVASVACARTFPRSYASRRMRLGWSSGDRWLDRILSCGFGPPLGFAPVGTRGASRGDMRACTAMMEARPIIQCSTGPFWAYDLDHAFDTLSEAGFGDIELMVTRDPATQDPDAPARLAKERGLRIASVHGPFLVVTKTVWGLDPIHKIERGVEMCRALGASTLVVHPPYLWERRYANWITHESDAYSREHGVQVAVETMYPRWVAGRRVRGHRWLEPAALVAAAPIVALDTSHLTVARYDVLDAYRILAPKLAHIHLSDNAGDGRDGHLELEQGIVPIDRFLTELRRTGYAGAVSLELSVRRYIERPKDLVGMFVRNRQYLEQKLFTESRKAKGLPRG